MNQQQLVVVSIHGDIHTPEVYLLQVAAMPEPLFFTGPFDKNPSHGFGCCSEEVLAVGPSLITSAHQAEIGFMHQGRWLQSMVGNLLGHLKASQPSKLLINERQ
jgi:hypothetical protein